MTVKDNTVQCDDCGLTIPVVKQSEWSQLNVKPKGIHVALDLCAGCTRKREPKPEVVHTPDLAECLTPYQVTGYLLWCSGHLIDVHLPSKRSVVVTVKECDSWHVMDIYEDTTTGKAQLAAMVEYLSHSEWGYLWTTTKVLGDNAERVKYCSDWIFEQQQSYF